MSVHCIFQDVRLLHVLVFRSSLRVNSPSMPDNALDDTGFVIFTLLLLWFQECF